MNKFLFLVFAITLIFPQKKIYWDLGIGINKIKSEKIIKPLIANTKVTPKYKESNNNYLLPFLENNFSKNQIMTLLYIKEQYAYLIDYANYLEINGIGLHDDEIYIIADALYRLGEYDTALIKLRLLSEYYPADEKYFLEALCNKKIGHLSNMNNLLQKIITKYPNSDYMKLAKLQFNILK